MLVSSLRHFQRKVIFSERTEFRKWSNTPFTLHSELKCWKTLLLFQRNACEFLWKRSSLFQHFNSLCEVNGVLLHFLYALLLEKITLFWNCLKILTSIHKELTSVSLKEKQSVPTLQFTVRSQWSVASLSKCCPFRENHFPLKGP